MISKIFKLYLRIYLLFLHHKIHFRIKNYDQVFCHMMSNLLKYNSDIISMILGLFTSRSQIKRPLLWRFLHDRRLLWRYLQKRTDPPLYHFISFWQVSIHRANTFLVMADYCPYFFILKGLACENFKRQSYQTMLFYLV